MDRSVRRKLEPRGAILKSSSVLSKKRPRCCSTDIPSPSVESCSIGQVTLLSSQGIPATKSSSRAGIFFESLIGFRDLADKYLIPPLEFCPNRTDGSRQHGFCFH